jgi:hypothetical protein
MTDTARLRELLRKATPLPWFVEGDMLMDACRSYVVCMFGTPDYQTVADAALLSAISHSLPALLDALDSAEARLAEAETLLRDVDDWGHPDTHNDYIRRIDDFLDSSALAARGDA